ncbi:hypothetical protein BJQ90_03432 [Arthrobacter sp. SO3]|nr:hypothetical protein [Arthrobacter sp. SO3]
MVPEGQGHQLQRSDPALGRPVKAGHVSRIQIQPVDADQEVLGFLRIEPQRDGVHFE